MQPKDSQNSSITVVIEEDSISRTKGIIFHSSTKEQLLTQELEVPVEEEEEETHFKH